MAQQDDVEARVTEHVNGLVREFSGLGDEMRWSITRALIHRAVHFATEAPGVEFCALATYLSEMIQHSHQLAHGDSPDASGHASSVH